MTLNQVMRAMIAAQRRAERESRRQQRELLRQHKEAAKYEALEQAAYEVSEYENWVERLKSVHRECSDGWDWMEILSRPAPALPIAVDTRERKAQADLQAYTPGFFDRIFRRGERKRAALAAAVEEGRRIDREANARAEAEFWSRHADWDVLRQLAARVVAGESRAFQEVIRLIDPFEELSEFGSSLDFGFTEDGRGVVRLQVNDETAIPREVKTLTQSGKLSTKRMAQGQFYELYQDFVCSAVFRAGRELFALLPLDTVIVTATANMLDTASGHMRDMPIVSVLMPRSTIVSLNFERLDPSDALRNFVHRMEFKKTKGFAPVEPLALEGTSTPTGLFAERSARSSFH